jgi:hypothetical protein
MVHKFDLKNVDVKAVLIIAQPTEDIKQTLPQDVPTKEVKESDIMTDYDDTMEEFTDSLGGFDSKDKPLVAEKSL